MHIRVTKHYDGTTWIATKNGAFAEPIEILIDEEAQAWLIHEILFGEVGDNDEA